MDHVRTSSQSSPDYSQTAADGQVDNASDAPKGDNDLREALRAMVTVVAIQAERGEGGQARVDAAAAIGRVLGVDLVTTAVRTPSALGRLIPIDPLVLQRLVMLLQHPGAGPVSRLAQAIDARTLALRPGFSQVVTSTPRSLVAERVPGRDNERNADDRNAPGRRDDSHRA